jgi:hypothetical protein
MSAGSWFCCVWVKYVYSVLATNSNHKEYARNIKGKAISKFTNKLFFGQWTLSKKNALVNIRRLHKPYETKKYSNFVDKKEELNIQFLPCFIDAVFTFRFVCL